jgi:uncharacterized protein YPO0396
MTDPVAISLITTTGPIIGGAIFLWVRMRSDARSADQQRTAKVIEDREIAKVTNAKVDEIKTPLKEIQENVNGNLSEVKSELKDMKENFKALADFVGAHYPKEPGKVQGVLDAAADAKVANGARENGA